MRTILLLLFASLCCRLCGQSTQTIGSTAITIDTVYTGLDVPWQVIYGPDGYLWVTERKGRISRIDPVSKTRSVVLDITSSVYAVQEAGMLGMALHPDFTVNQELFVVFTYSSGSLVKERLVKYIFTNGQLGSPSILIDNIAGGTAHNGSRLLFLPDKTLLMTTGDAHIAGAPQDESALNGKVLRLNTDGSVPANNPFPGKYAYTKGHRNAQGMCAGPGGIYLSEHGPTTDDEFQLLSAGANYGWPNVEGFCDKPAEITFCAANTVKEPIVDWTPTIAPAGMIYYTNNNFPEFDGCFLLSTLKTKKLMAIRLNAAGTASVSESSWLTGQFGRLRDVCTGPQKEIYIATNGPEAFNAQPNTHSILVLRPPPPVVSVQEHTGMAALHLYPTLTAGLVFLEGLGNDREAAYEVIDLRGKMLLKGKLQGAAGSIDVDALAGGIYLLCVKTEEGLSRCWKIIRQ